MFFILAETTVPLETVLWIAATLIGIVGVLISVIAFILYNRMTAAEGSNAVLDKKVDEKFSLLQQRIDTERIERTNKHDDLARRVFEEIDKTKDRCGDLTETVAGMGAVYVTRSEYLADRKKKSES